MTLNLDTSRRPHRPSEWVAVVEAIKAADPSDETDWLEWKRAVSISAAEGRFKLAEGILGFTNRDPARAARNLEGHALFVVGVEPGQVHGVTPIQPLDLENALEPFLGSDGPEWEVVQPQVGGKSVLIVCVRPPQPGDRIHTLRRNFKNYHPGRIFIRRGAKTVEADDAEIRMLEQRLLAGQASTDIARQLTVEWASKELLEVVDVEVDDTQIDAITEIKRQQLLEGHRPAVKHRSSPLVPDISFVFARLDDMNAGYRRKVGEYLPTYHRWLVDWIVEMVACVVNPALAVRLANRSDRNMESVALVLQVPVGLKAFEDRPFEELVTEEPPTPPTPPTQLPIGAAIGAPFMLRSDRGFHMPGWTAKSLDGVTTIEFDPVELRPRATVELPSIRVVPQNTDDDPAVVPVKWSATARSHDSVAQGELQLSIGSAVDIDYELVRRTLRLDEEPTG